MFRASVISLGAAAPRLDRVDVIASPTLCLTPPLMSEVADADSHLRVNRRIVRNTVAVNYLGLCAITMPVGRDRAGMPVGLQLTAPAYAEEKLLTIALAAEQRARHRGGPARNAASARFVMLPIARPAAPLGEARSLSAKHCPA